MSVGGRLGRDGIAAATTIGAVQVVRVVTGLIGGNST
jgi:hypothetical protein